jgi:hypothetical protein
MNTWHQYQYVHPIEEYQIINQNIQVYESITILVGDPMILLMLMMRLLLAMKRGVEMEMVMLK